MVIAGAGASLPFLAVGNRPFSTQLISKEVKKDRLWKAVWEKFDRERKLRDSRHIGHVKDNLELDEVLELRDVILNILGKTYLGDTNFEYLIHLMDKTSYYLLAQRQYHQGTKISVNSMLQLDALLLGIEGTLHNRFPKSDAGGWRYIPFLSREVILEIVDQAWNSLGSRKDKILNLHRSFLETAIKKYELVHIYSLNYDPLLIEAIQSLDEYSTGFINSGEFMPYMFGNTPGVLALFHGNGAFFCQNGKIMMSAKYSDTQNKRIGKIVQGSCVGAFGDKGLHGNIYLVTGLDKTEQLTFDPYTTYLHSLAIDTYNSDVICIIGWSFGDDYIKPIFYSSSG